MPDEPVRAAEVHAEDPRAALGGVAAELAHELRNVLATIAASAHAAARTPADAARFLARIGRHAELGQRLVDDVLALAAPLDALAREPHDVVQLLAEARATLEEQATFRDRIEVPTLPVHRVLFGRLLHALYANAAAVGRGNAQIETHVHADADTLRIDVHDDGPGIPEAIRATLFEPFASAREGGTGLGLSLARRIARAHGGQLTLHEVAAGTTFRIALPSR